MPGNNGILPYTAYAGIVPGSQGMPAYGSGGLTSIMQRPDAGAMRYQDLQNQALGQNTAIAGKKWGMLQNVYGNLLGSFGHNGWGTGFMNQQQGGGVPAPRYGSISNVYSPQEISSQANAQRANLYAQAQNADRQFGYQASRSGFSPMSPLMSFMTNTNDWRANSAAAQNETGLRFTAAKANTDAALQQQGINAGLYSDYTKALGQQAGQQEQFQLGQRGQNLDMLHYLLGALG